MATGAHATVELPRNSLPPFFFCFLGVPFDFQQAQEKERFLFAGVRIPA